MSESTFNLERKLAGGILLLLLVGCLLVLLPFIPALLWALILGIATWPAYQRLLRLFGRRPTLVASAMTLALVLIMLVPLVLLGSKVAASVDDVTAAGRQWIEAGPPAAPAWLRNVPAVGTRAADTWTSLANDTEKLFAKGREWLPAISANLLKLGLLVSAGLLQLTLSIFITFFLLCNAELLRDRLRWAVKRIAGNRGVYLVDIAAGTIRGVVYGILGTAFIQAVMAGFGFAIAGVPGAAALAFVLFFLSVVPMGPLLVLVPAVLWLFHQGHPGWGTFMIVWGLIVSSIDNVIKPWLISQGSSMPFLLIFFGVIGGAVAFGFIGVFLGPTLLAVGYRLVEEWNVGRMDGEAIEASGAQRPG